MMSKIFNLNAGIIMVLPFHVLNEKYFFECVSNSLYLNHHWGINKKITLNTNRKWNKESIFSQKAQMQ